MQLSFPKPEDAQQAIVDCVSRVPLRVIREVFDQNLLNIADMMPRQGFTGSLSGLLTLIFVTDCRRTGLSCVEPPLGGIVAVSI